MRIKYKNENLRKKVRIDKVECCLHFGTLFFSLLLIFLSFFNTYRDIYKRRDIHFSSLVGYSDIVYTLDLDKMPEEIAKHYYMAPADGKALMIHNCKDALDELEQNGSVTLRGRIRKVNENFPEPALAAQEYYEKNGLFSGEESEKYSYYYLDCFPISFSDVLTNDHPVGLVFGITFLIVLAIGREFSSPYNYFKHLRPASTGRRYKPGEIDELANMYTSRWIELNHAYLTPHALIFTEGGMTVVEFDDIEELYFKKIRHTRRIGMGHRIPSCNRYRTFYTYPMYVKTKSGKRLRLTDNGVDGAIKDRIIAVCGDGKFKEGYKK
ncbi:hypothetical protein SAMN02910447_03577 [Ruminococcus sp. YE71]|uniref:hypothetical protein n=1 Tax=unclassified Ruminococcus TaxID=2608920 RepID=UPI000890B7F2|nr:MULTISPECIES: hypothetical protein [unclassified Ruminococcus]SDA32887.1 hypothetical protein SAMN02910446_03660 [Ruminococcus sp. YE78]SFW53969.1 hypothetical protein SAMN02910447_03577 [Ruminococcus sp. YE71]